MVNRNRITIRMNTPRINPSIPLEYGEEFIEEANNLDLKHVDTILSFVRQAIRARLSCLLSTTEPDEHDSNILECNLAVRYEPEKPSLNINRIVQYQGGEIDIFINGIAYDIDSISIEILTAITKALFPETN